MESAVTMWRDGLMEKNDEV